jgi:hypothetical protein
MLVLRYVAMVDGVALIASVVTIATVIIEGVKHAKTFYRAFEEFSAGSVETNHCTGFNPRFNQRDPRR